jgi:hypothetical protein
MRAYIAAAVWLALLVGSQAANAKSESLLDEVSAGRRR